VYINFNLERKIVLYKIVTLKDASSMFCVQHSMDILPANFVVERCKNLLHDLLLSSISQHSVWSEITHFTET